LRGAILPISERKHLTRKVESNEQENQDW
jgi:hypothetical protein